VARPTNIRQRAWEDLSSGLLARAFSIKEARFSAGLESSARTGAKQKKMEAIMANSDFMAASDSIDF